MSSTCSPASPRRRHPQPDGSGSWEPESPFVDHLVLAEAPSQRPSRGGVPPAVSPYATESPFLSVYETGSDDDHASPQAAELYRILGELRDAEFDAAVYQLQAEAYDLLAPRLEGEDDLSDYEVEQFFEAHFGPLVRETSRLLDGMAGEIERHDVDHMTEPEIDQLLAGFEPEGTGLTPSFEGFLKRVWKKGKTAVKKVASAARKGIVKAVKTVGKIATAPAAIVLKKLKTLVRPLLQKVLRSAIGRLPEPLQDAARQAAQKLFGGKARTIDPEDTEPAVPDDRTVDGFDATDDEVGYLQSELDLQMANLILADDETRQDVAIAEYEARARRLGVAPYVRLRRARRRFVRELEALGDDEDATPAVERFVPAILPALKLGVKVIGRKRAVDTLAALVGNLLRSFVGPKMSRPLANAIADAGLKLVGLEMRDEDRAAAAAEATAAVVEDTVRRVAQLPADVLQDEVFLEAVAEEAFDAALSRNLPPMPRRPDLVRSELPERWLPRGNYRRYAFPITITISPQMAYGLKTFGGATPTVLGRSLKELVGAKATVRLYEAIDGTWLSKIARDEKDVPGLGSADAIRWRSIHPLTVAAAALLLKDPGMGTEVDPKYLRHPDTIAVGQRFYYLQLDQTPGGGGDGGGGGHGHASALFYVLDCPQRFVSVTFYLSEQETQAIAKHLRTGDASGAGKELAKVWIRMGLRAVRQGLGDAVDIRNEAIEIQHAVPAILVRLAPVILTGLKWLVVNLGPAVARILFDVLIAEEFVRLADDPRDGVTFELAWKDPVGLGVICRMLNAEDVPLKDFERELKKMMAGAAANLPTPRIVAGYHRD
jgi:hypothetical protein